MVKAHNAPKIFINTIISPINATPATHPAKYVTILPIILVRVAKMVTTFKFQIINVVLFNVMIVPGLCVPSVDLEPLE